MTVNASSALKPEKRTIVFDHEANAYLTELFPTGRGVGQFCSILVHQHKWRREHAEQYHAAAATEEWYAESGLNSVE